MSREMRTMGARLDRGRALGVFAAVALGVVALVLWWMRQGEIGAVVAAERSSVRPGEVVALHAKVWRKRSGKEVRARECTFAWSAKSGTVLGTGADVTWTAPTDADDAVRVNVHAECDDRKAEASLDVPVEGRVHVGEAPHSWSRPAQPAVTVDKPQQKSQGDGAPVIDSIVVEKTEVCRGEDTLVTVRAHDPKGKDDAWLDYVVGEQVGASVPVNYVTDSSTPRLAIVHGKRNETFTLAELPHVTVKDCVVPRRVLVSYSLIPNTEDRFRFAVQVAAVGDKTPLEVCAFEWDFGDAATETTNAPWAEHSYLDRPQTTLETSFLVRVRVMSCDGQSLVGRTAVTLRNNYFVQREVKHISGLVITTDPRYPEKGPDGVVRQTALIRTFEPDPVTITKVTSLDTDPSVSDAELAAVPVPVGQFFHGSSAIIGSDWTHVPLTLDTKASPHLLMRRYVLEGRTQDDVPVYGSVSIMVPPTVDPKTSQPVFDPDQKKRIMAAMDLLGKKQVSQEELDRLEREGKLPRRTTNALDRNPSKMPPDFVQPVDTSHARPGAGPQAPGQVPPNAEHAPNADAPQTNGPDGKPPGSKSD